MRTTTIAVQEGAPDLYLTSERVGWTLDGPYRDTRIQMDNVGGTGGTYDVLYRGPAGIFVPLPRPDGSGDYTEVDQDEVVHVDPNIVITPVILIANMDSVEDAALITVTSQITGL